MSILIKGAEAPSGCRWCYFNDDSRCALIVGCDCDDTNGAQRRENCPLIELPDHGDLIDRDALKEKAEFIGDDVTGICGYAVWESDILNAPTVIPAERSEDGET